MKTSTQILPALAAACIALATQACRDSAGGPSNSRESQDANVPVANILLTQEPVAPLPELELVEVLSGLQAAADKVASLLPDASREAELLDLVRTAFGAEGGGGRMQSMAQRSLEDEADAWRGYELGLSVDDASVRTQCAFALASSNHAGSLSLVLYRHKYEKDPSVRLWLVDAAVGLGSGAGLLDVIAAFDDSELREQAGRVAVSVCGRVGADIGDNPSWAMLRQALAGVDLVWRETGVLPGVEAMGSGEELLDARIAEQLVALTGFQLRPVDDARFVLSRMGTVGLPRLTAAAHAQETYLRNHSLEVLRDLGPVAHGAGEALLSLLRDPLSAAIAGRALGAARYEPAMPHLIARIADADLETAAAAAAALGPMLTRAPSSPKQRGLQQRAVATLQRVLDDPTGALDLRVSAATSLAHHELQQPARGFLYGLLQAGEYHEPTLREALQNLDKAASRQRAAQEADAAPR